MQAAAIKLETSVDDVLSRVDNLPMLSHVALEVGELVNDPRASAREISDLMREDPSLSAKVLRLVNSPYYAIPGGVSDVARAISFIGFSTLHQLVLSVTVMRSFQLPEGASFDARELWLHSLAVGSCAEVIARRIGHRDPGGCFTAGLLHDVGKIALATTETVRFGAAIELARKQGISMHVSERQVGLPSHESVGNRLAKRWKFPAVLLAPITHHHDTLNQQLRRELSPALLAVIDIVSVANDLCRHYKLGDGGSSGETSIDLGVLAQLGMTTIQVDALYSDLMRKLEKSKVFLQLLES